MARTDADKKAIELEREVDELISQARSAPQLQQAVTQFALTVQQAD